MIPKINIFQYRNAIEWGIFCSVTFCTVSLRPWVPLFLPIISVTQWYPKVNFYRAQFRAETLG